MKRLTLSLLCAGVLLCTASAFSASTTSIAAEIQQITGDEPVSSKIQAPYGVRIASITDNGIEVYWKLPEISDGYEVFRSYEMDAGFELIADLENHHDWSYFDTSFDSDQRTIYYKVRNYVYDENHTRQYSSWCKTMTASYRTSILLSRKSILYIASGYTTPLEAYFGWNTLHDVKWSSNDPAIASVDENGLLHANKKGSCSITAASRTAGSSKTIQVCVDREATSMLDEYTSRFTEITEDYWVNPDAEETQDAVLMILGDLMCMKPQQKEQGGASGDFNFNESYDYVKDIFAESDYTIGNLETILDSSYPYYLEMGTTFKMPNCNAPARFLDALKYAGIDGVYTSNNHNCDADIHGILETLNQLDRYEIGNTGFLSGKEDNRTLIADVNGIKVGFLSYATSFNRHDQRWNPDDVNTYLNYYEEEKAKKDVALLKEQGAEYIIVFMHWGTKNCVNYNEKQTKMAQELADMGVDYIAGAHPHVLQAYDEIVSSDGKIVPCIYSLGDFNSSLNQIPGNRDTIILRIRLVRNEDQSIELVENNYIPCYTYTEYNEKHYVTMPLNYDIIDERNLSKYDTFRKRISDILGDKIEEYIWQK